MAAQTLRLRERILRKAGACSPNVLAAAVGALGQALGTGCVGVAYPEPVYGKVRPACNVPPGHLPPPGECRLRYPDLPPGQQPPPGDCYELEQHAPGDACRVHGG